MAKSGKYGNVDIPKVANDEPVFILRAQDKLALPTIKMYQLMAESHGLQLAGMLQQQINSFGAWKGAMKMPD
jgi:hypothetical protein